MTEKVSLRRQDGLPMPPVSPETPEALARWYRGRLLRDLDRGKRALTIACFDTAPFGFPVSQAAAAVLRAVTDLLYDRPEAESLRILCGDEAAFRAYRFHWNMWYAEHKPDHGDAADL